MYSPCCFPVNTPISNYCYFFACHDPIYIDNGVAAVRKVTKVSQYSDDGFVSLYFAGSFIRVYSALAASLDGSQPMSNRRRFESNTYVLARPPITDTTEYVDVIRVYDGRAGGAARC